MFKRYFVLSAVVLGIALGLSLALYRTRETSRVQVESPREEDALHSTTTTNNYSSITANSNSTVVVTNTTPVAVTNAPPQPSTLNPQPTNAVKRPASRPRRRVPTTYAPDVPKSRQVLLANRRIVVKEGRSFPKAFCAAQSPTARGTAPYIVISELPASRDVRIQATADGAKVIGFLPNNALLVEADAQALKNLENDVLFMAAVEYEPTDKIQRALLDAKPDESVEATIVLLNEADRATVESFVTAEGGKMVEHAPSSVNTIVAQFKREAITSIAKKGEVKWIERYQRMRVNNYWSAQAPCHAVAPVWDELILGLTGEGQVVGTLDTGLDTGDIKTLNKDFEGRIVDIVAVDEYTKDYNGHGTHTAGSIVGTGVNSPDVSKLICGMAHGARLYVMSGSDGTGSQEIYIPGAYTLFSYGHAHNVCIHSDSWGGATSDSPYVNYCADLDSFVWNNPYYLPVFAAGNSGEDKLKTCLDYPGTAKNCLTVGAAGTANNGSGNYTSMASFSSYGPCADGRRKPDITASGVSINSVSKDGGYVQMSGTSMATPITAGSVALIRQWLVRDRGFDDKRIEKEPDRRPTAALMKAIVTGGARDMYLEQGNANTGGFAPNSKQGWGRLFLRETIDPTDGRSVRLYDRIAYSNNSEVVYRIETKAVGDLDLQLTWVDYPSQAGAAVNLVNDLDLEVVNERTGESWTPNDHVNNDEGLRIRNAMADAYLVKVRGYQVSYDSEDGGAAALYMRGAFEAEGTRYDGEYDALPCAADTTNMVGVAIIGGKVRSEGPISLANARKRYEFAEGCDIMATRLVVGNNDYSSQNITQTGGTVDITDAGSATSTTDGPVLLGHWKGVDRSYIMTGGEFYATNGIMRLGWDGGCVLKIGGETTTARMRLKGLKAGGERSNAGSLLTVLPNGILELGASGLNVATANIPVTLSGGTLMAYENATISIPNGIALTTDSTIEVPKGIKLTLDTTLNGDFKVNKTGEGRLILNDTSQASKFNLIEGTLTGPEWTPPASPVTIDVLVAFEAGAKDYVENDQGMTLEEFSRAQVAKMNAVLPNTELNKCFKFRYVGCTNINVTCTDIGTVLYRSTYSEDYPEYQPISNLRDVNGADVVLVMLYPEDSTGGTAGGSYGLQSYETVAEHSEKAYSVVSVVAAVQQDTSVHEIGHLMGAGHPDKPDPGGQHWKDYSYGLYFTDKDGYRWHTIMGYGSHGGLSYSATQYFSSPEYLYRGVPVGTLENDNTRTLRESCEGVSQWRPTKIIDPTEAEKAAQKSPSKPVLLVDAGTSTKPATKDNWIAFTCGGQASFTVGNDVATLAGVTTPGLYWPDGTAEDFLTGSNCHFADIYGAAWSSVWEEMLVSLGLRGTKEVDVGSFFKTCIHNGQNRGSTLTVSGLDTGKRYVLHYLACDANTDKKNGSFKLQSSGYSGTPTIDCVKGTNAVAYAHWDDVSTAITAAANEPLLVRVSNLRPNAQGKVVIDVGGATMNVLAIAEMPSPLLYYLAQSTKHKAQDTKHYDD